MVLDLRLVKIGCRETINFFCTYTKKQGAGDVSPQVYRRNRIIRQLKFFENQFTSYTAPIFWNRNPTPRSAPTCRACMVGLSTNRALLTLGEPSPACERASVQTRSHLGADAVASRPRRGCVWPRVRRQSLSKLFSTPLPTFQHSNEAAIRRKEGTIKRERVISLPWHVPNSLSNCLVMFKK